MPGIRQVDGRRGGQGDGGDGRAPATGLRRVGPRKCLEVNGRLFYEGIDGFKHKKGYTYRLKIERYDAFPGEKEPPQDASRYGYRLMEVISKTSR